jgi:hypothetical protein
VPYRGYVERVTSIKSKEQQMHSLIIGIVLSFIVTWGLLLWLVFRVELSVGLASLILRKEFVMSQELDALTAQVQANEDLEASAITLIQGIAAQLVAAKDDPAKIAALAASLNTSASALSAAIVANTPAA